MSGEFEKDFESGTERRRSRSGVPDSSGPREGPPGPGEFREDLERDGVDPPGDPSGDGDEGPAGVANLPGDGPRPPNLTGRTRRGRVLRKPELPRGPLTAEKKLLLLDTWRKSGLPARDFAALTGLSRQCLYVWQRKFKLEGPGGLMEKPRGGPRGSRLGDLTQRTILMLKETHPEWGTERIPAITRRETRAILTGYREHYRETHPFLDIRLRWNLPGAVWAMDHTLIEGEKVFTVKDLATRRQLLYLPVEDLGADRVVGALERLFATHARPLVVKSDQGSAFTAEETESFLKRQEVFLLLSPPRRPQYNGSIESRIRWLKCRARFQTPGPGLAVSPAAKSRALELTNEHYSTNSGWPPIDEALRTAFRRQVAETADDAGQKRLYTQRAWPRVRRKIWRHAIASALEAHGILQVRRREIPLPNRFLFAARIS